MPCPHLSSMKNVSAVDLKMRAQGSCDKCEKQGNLWACLQHCCSYVGCGRCSNNHIELHNQETDHHLCINLENYKVWCFGCRSSVDPSTSSADSTPVDRVDTPTRTHRGHYIPDEDDFFELEQGLKPRGLCGLMNIGNTCYMNAALQALSNCPPLTQFFLECNAWTSETKHPGVSRNYSNITRELWSRKRAKYIVPTQLLRSVRAVNSQFRGYGQQDAQEFLRCIMDQLHEELKQPIVTLVSDSESSDESDEPNHQAKRLLGGTSLPSSSLHDDETDSGVSSVSRHGKFPIPPPSHAEGMPLDRRRSSAVLDSSDIQIDIDMNEQDAMVEDEPMEVQEDSGAQSMDSQSTSSTETIIRKESFDDKKPASAVEKKTSGKKGTGTGVNMVEENTTKQVVNKTINYQSIITDLFDGRVQSSVQCLTCNRVSSRIETFQDLSLPIPGKDELSVIHASQCSPLVTCSRGDTEYPDVEKGWVMSLVDWVRRWLFGPQVTLQDCLSAFFSADELKGDNMYSCEKCKKLRNGIKLCKVLHLPEILCIHLKRFRHEMYFSSKINHFISFPVTCLDMKPFLLRDSYNNIGERPTTTYDLVAVITHHGNVGAGHYVAFAKNYISGTWFEFNDSWVTEVSESYVAGVEAYVLFYRKTSEQSSKERRTFATMMNTKESHVQCNYISRLWLTKFQTCAEPGPISNTDFICPHGGIHPKRQDKIKEFVTAVPAVVWNHLYKRYGGGPVVSSLEPCQHCKTALEELERRRLYEVETFKKFNTDYPAADHVDVYCISMRWFRQWEAFVKGQEEDPPGPIDNKNIVIVKGNQKILKSTADYGQVAMETWKFLHDIYGGGPSFVLEAETEEQES